MGRADRTRMGIYLGIEISELGFLIDRSLQRNRSEFLFNILFNIEDSFEERFYERRENGDNHSCSLDSINNTLCVEHLPEKDLSPYKEFYFYNDIKNFMSLLLKLVNDGETFTSSLLISPIEILTIPCTTNYCQVTSMSIDEVYKVSSVEEQLNNLAKELDLEADEYKLARWINITE